MVDGIKESVKGKVSDSEEKVRRHSVKNYNWSTENRVGLGLSDWEANVI